MILIFGAGKPKVTSYGMVEHDSCSHCHNKERWKLEKISKYFTLFFLPIFPYKTIYILYCPICKSHEKLNQEEFERYRLLAGRPL